MKHNHDAGRIIIDELAYSSVLRNTSPILKIYISVISLLICIISHSIPVSILILISMLFMMIGIGKTKIHHVLHLMNIPLFFIIAGSIMIMITISNSSDNMIFYLKIFNHYLGATSESIYKFSVIFIQCLASVSCLYFLSVTTPMTELFTALRRLRVPVFLVEIMELVYRYIFVLLEISLQIKNAQECRLGYSRLSTSFRSFSQLVSGLFIRSYRQAERTYTAMESRGYDNSVITIGMEYRINKNQIVYTSLYTAVLIFVSIICNMVV